MGSEIGSTSGGASLRRRPARSAGSAGEACDSLCNNGPPFKLGARRGRCDKIRTSGPSVQRAFRAASPSLSFPGYETGRAGESKPPRFPRFPCPKRESGRTAGGGGSSQVGPAPGGERRGRAAPRSFLMLPARPARRLRHGYTVSDERSASGLPPLVAGVRRSRVWTLEEASGEPGKEGRGSAKGGPVARGRRRTRGRPTRISLRAAWREAAQLADLHQTDRARGV